MSVAIPFTLCGENISYDDLPYDYIDHSQLKITKDNVEQVVRRNAELRKQQKEPDGFFIGIGGVLARTNDAYRSITLARDYSNRLYYYNYTTAIDGGIAMLLGYKHFFGSGVWGLRYYADYNIRFITMSGAPSTTNIAHNITFDFDFLINIARTQIFKFGLVIGLGYGLVYEDIKKDYCISECGILSESIKGNFGLRFVIKDSFAIETLFQPQYSGAMFAYTNRYDRYDSFGSYSSYQPESSNNISETALIGTIRFIYTF